MMMKDNAAAWSNDVCDSWKICGLFMLLFGDKALAELDTGQLFNYLEHKNNRFLSVVRSDPGVLKK